MNKAFKRDSSYHGGYPFLPDPADVLQAYEQQIAERPINIGEEYRRIVLQGEPILDDLQNIVILSKKSYEEMAKAKRNAEYMEMLKKSDDELKAGKVVVKTMEEL